MPDTYTDWSAKNPIPDQVESLRRFNDYSRAEYLRQGQLTPELNEEMDKNAFQFALDKGAIPAPADEAALQESFKSFVLRPQADSVLALAGDKLSDEGNNEGALKVKGYLAAKKQAGTPIITDQEEYASRLESLRKEAEPFLDEASLNNAKRYAVKSGKAKFATVVEDGRYRVIADPSLGELDDTTIAAYAEANPDLIDSRALLQIQQSFRNIPGLDVTPALLERKSDLETQMIALATRDPAAMRDLESAVAGFKSDNRTTGKTVVDSVFGIPAAVIKGVGFGLKSIASGKNELATASSGPSPDSVANVADRLSRSELGRNASPQEIFDAVQDFATTRGVDSVEFDEKNPAGATRRLSTGMYAIPKRIQVNKDLFEKTIEALPTTKEQKDLMRGERTANLDAYAKELIPQLIQAKGSLADVYQQGKDAGKSDGEIIEQIAASGDYNGAVNRLESFGISVGRILTDLIPAVGALVPGYLGKGIKDIGYSISRDISSEQAANSALAGVFGKDFGWGQQFVEQVPQLIADIYVSRGMGRAAGAVGRIASTSGRVAAASLIGAETAEILANFTKRTAGRAVSLVGESTAKDFAKALRAAPNEIGWLTSQGAREFGSTYSSTRSSLEAQRAPDGSKKFTPEQVETLSTEAAALSAFWSNAVTLGFNRIGGGKLAGAETLATGRGISMGKLKSYYDDVVKGVEKLAPEVRSQISLADFDTFAKDVVKTAFAPAKEILLGSVGEGAEEFIQNVASDVVQSAVTGKNFDLTDSARSAALAASFGFALGGGSEAVSVAEQRYLSDPAYKQADFEANYLGRTIENLKASGSPATASFLQRQLDLAQQNKESIRARFTQFAADETAAAEAQAAADAEEFDVFERRKKLDANLVPVIGSAVERANGQLEFPFMSRKVNLGSNVEQPAQEPTNYEQTELGFSPPPNLVDSEGAPVERANGQFEFPFMAKWLDLGITPGIVPIKTATYEQVELPLGEEAAPAPLKNREEETLVELHARTTPEQRTAFQKAPRRRQQRFAEVGAAVAEIDARLRALDASLGALKQEVSSEISNQSAVETIEAEKTNLEEEKQALIGLAVDEVSAPLVSVADMDEVLAAATVEVPEPAANEKPATTATKRRVAKARAVQQVVEAIETSENPEELLAAVAESVGAVEPAATTRRAPYRSSVRPPGTPTPTENAPRKVSEAGKTPAVKGVAAERQAEVTAPEGTASGNLEGQEDLSPRSIVEEVLAEKAAAKANKKKLRQAAADKVAAETAKFTMDDVAPLLDNTSEIKSLGKGIRTTREFLADASKPEGFLSPADFATYQKYLQSGEVPKLNQLQAELAKQSYGGLGYTGPFYRSLKRDVQAAYPVYAAPEQPTDVTSEDLDITFPLAVRLSSIGQKLQASKIALEAALETRLADLQAATPKRKTAANLAVVRTRVALLRLDNQIADRLVEGDYQFEREPESGERRIAKRELVTRARDGGEVVNIKLAVTRDEGGELVGYHTNAPQMTAWLLNNRFSIRVPKDQLGQLNPNIEVNRFRYVTKVSLPDGTVVKNAGDLKAPMSAYVPEEIRIEGGPDNPSQKYTEFTTALPKVPPSLTKLLGDSPSGQKSSGNIALGEDVWINDAINLMFGGKQSDYATILYSINQKLIANGMDESDFAYTVLARYQRDLREFSLAVQLEEQLAAGRDPVKFLLKVVGPAAQAQLIKTFSTKGKSKLNTEQAMKVYSDRLLAELNGENGGNTRFFKQLKDGTTVRRPNALKTIIAQVEKKYFNRIKEQGSFIDPTARVEARESTVTLSQAEADDLAASVYGSLGDATLLDVEVAPEETATVPETAQSVLQAVIGNVDANPQTRKAFERAATTFGVSNAEALSTETLVDIFRNEVSEDMRAAAARAQQFLLTNEGLEIKRVVAATLQPIADFEAFVREQATQVGLQQDLASKRAGDRAAKSKTLSPEMVEMQKYLFPAGGGESRPVPDRFFTPEAPQGVNLPATEAQYEVFPGTFVSLEQARDLIANLAERSVDTQYSATTRRKYKKKATELRSLVESGDIKIKKDLESTIQLPSGTTYLRSDLRNMLAAARAGQVDERYSMDKQAQFRRFGDTLDSLLASKKRNFKVGKDIEAVFKSIAVPSDPDTNLRNNLIDVESLGLRGGSILSAIEALDKVPMRLKEVAALLKSARGILSKANIEIVNLPNTGWAGKYSPESNTIFLNLSASNGRGLADVLVHEMLHAVTVSVINNPQTAGARALVAKLDALRGRIKAAYKGDSQQVLAGLASLEEFVSYAFTSPDFQKAIYEAAPDRNFFRRFIDFLTRFLTGNPTDQLSKALNDLTKLVGMANMRPYGTRISEDVAMSRDQQAVKELYSLDFGSPEYAAVRFSPEERSKWKSLAKAASNEDRVAVELELENRFSESDQEAPNFTDATRKAWERELFGIFKRAGIDSTTISKNFSQLKRGDTSKKATLDYELESYRAFFDAAGGPLMDFVSQKGAEHQLDVEGARPSDFTPEDFRKALTQLMVAMDRNRTSGVSYRQDQVAKIVGAYIEAFSPEQELPALREWFSSFFSNGSPSWDYSIVGLGKQEDPVFSAKVVMEYYRQVLSTPRGEKFPAYPNQLSGLSWRTPQELQKLTKEGQWKQAEAKALAAFKKNPAYTGFSVSPIFESPGSATLGPEGGSQGDPSVMSSLLSQESPSGITIQYDESARGMMVVRPSAPDTVFVNPQLLARAIEGLSEFNARRFVRAAVNHEIAHLAAFSTLSDADINYIATNLPASKLWEVADRYYSSMIPDSAARFQRIREDRAAGKLSIRELADEFVRMEIEKARNGFISESDYSFYRRNPGMLSRMLRALEAFIAKLVTRVRGIEDSEIAASVQRATRIYNQLVGDAPQTMDQKMDVLRREDVTGRFTLPVQNYGENSYDVGGKISRLFKGDLPSAVKALLGTRDNQLRLVARISDQFNRKMQAFRKSGLVNDENLTLVRNAMGDTGLTIPKARMDQIQAVADGEIAVIEKAFEDSGKTESDKLIRDKGIVDALDRLKKAEIREYQLIADKARAAAAEAKTKLDPKVVRVIEDARAAIDKASGKLAVNPFTPDDVRLVIDANNGIYLTRSYHAFTQVGWTKLLKSAKVEKVGNTEIDFEKIRDNALKHYTNKASKAIEAETKKAHPEFSPAEVKATVLRETPARAQTMFDNFVATMDSNAAGLATGQILAVDVEKALFEEGAVEPQIRSARANELRQELGRFMEKKELPAWLRQALGEITDPVEAATRSLISVSKLAANQEFLTSILESGLAGDWITKDPILANQRGYIELAGATPAYDAPLVGAYGPPEFKKAIDTIFLKSSPELEDTAGQAVKTGIKFLRGAAGGAMAAKTLLSVGFYSRNAVSDFAFFGPLQGVLLNPGNFKRWMQSKGSAFAKSPGEHEAYIRELIELGVLGDESSTQALRDQIAGYATDAEAALNKVERTALAGQTEAFWKKAGGVLAKVLSFGADLNNTISSNLRIGLYEHELEVLRKAYEGDESWTEERLKKAAAAKVLRTTQTHSQVFPVVTKFTKSGLGSLIAPFARFKAEVARVMIETIKLANEERASDNEVIRKRGNQRLAGYLTTLTLMPLTVAGAVSLLFAAAFGDDEDVAADSILSYFLPRNADQLRRDQALRAGLADWQKGNTVYFTQVGDKIRSLDMTFVNPTALYTDPFMRSYELIRTGKIAEIPKVFSKWVAGQLVGDQIAIGAAMEAFNNKDEKGNPITTGDTPFLEALFTRTGYAMSQGYKPPAASFVQNLMSGEKGSHKPVTEDDKTMNRLEILAGELMGVRPRVDEVSVYHNRAVHDAALTYSQSRRATGILKSRSPLQAEQIEEAIQKANRARVSAFGSAAELMKEFEKMGMTKGQMISAATAQGFSKDRLNKALANVTDRWNPSRDDFKEIYDAGQKADGNGAGRLKLVVSGSLKYPAVQVLNP